MRRKSHIEGIFKKNMDILDAFLYQRTQSDKLESLLMSYTSAKSQLVKGLIRGSSWKDRDRRRYVDDLIRIERYVLTGPKGFADALYANQLKAKYSREAMIIFEELKPEEYKKFIEETERSRKKSREEAKRLAKERKIKEERLKRDWLKMGGAE